MRTTSAALAETQLSGTAHKIERPSLLFGPVDDEIDIVGNADVTAKS